MKITAIIPARMGSSRFPGKPLARICGYTMIEHVFRRVRLAQTLSEVVVATCDREIAEEVERFGGCAVMTSNKHETQYRYIMSLGFKNNSYKDMLALHKQGLLLQ